MTYGLGRVPSPFDSRDYNLKDFMYKKVSLKMPKTVNWLFPGIPLDQGTTGHCVGFSMGSFGINLPINTFYTNEDGHKFYYKCKIEDGEPNQENGSCIRSAAKVLKKEGKIDGYAFAPDMGTIKWWLLNKSPMIVGTIWTEEMFLPDFKNALNIGGEVIGGHAYLINEWTEDNMIGIQNSWGSGWGINGKAYISASNFEKLFIRDGEALAAVEVELVHKCFLTDLLLK